MKTPKPTRRIPLGSQLSRTGWTAETENAATPSNYPIRVFKDGSFVATVERLFEDRPLTLTTKTVYFWNNSSYDTLREIVQAMARLSERKEPVPQS